MTCLLNNFCGKMERRFFLVFFIWSAFGFLASDQVSIEEDLTLTASQKAILDRFREVVGPSLPHDYMKRDIYLIRWLRAKNFDVTQAALLLSQNLLWRKEQKMDDILYEDWSNFEQRFPYYLEGCDKSGRPVASIPVGDWDVRSAVLAGQKDKVTRYFDKLIEEINTLVRMAQDDGKVVTQYTLIFDMGNYNLVEQGCAQCISTYLYLFNSYEAHWPGNVHKMFLVNTPPIFEVLLNIIKPLMSPLTRDALLIFGRNKEEWRKAIRTEVEPSEIQEFYGGRRDSGWEPRDARLWKTMKCNADIEKEKKARNSANSAKTNATEPVPPQREEKDKDKDVDSSSNAVK